jgi:coenzyme F420 hydrogenase subunit beta
MSARRPRWGPLGPPTLEQIVANDLCIGCGLCASVAGHDRVALRRTDVGTDRAIALRPLDPATERQIAAVCPGVRAEGPPDRGGHPFWGRSLRFVRAHASDPDVRHRGSSGGTLSALAAFLVDSGRVDFVLHVGASLEEPMRTERRLSFSGGEVVDNVGSRYGPATPLIDFCELLDRGRPFAVVGKPCDIGAIANLAEVDPRVDELVRYRLSFFCGGASELTPAREFVREHGLDERDLRLFRYRGHGNPGMTRMETHDGRAIERTYDDFWTDDVGNWKIQFRCKICPDAIGERADLVAMDVWPGGMPGGEDEGYNGLLARTETGAGLLADAVAAGALTVAEELPEAAIEDFQPHHRRRKEAVLARAAAVSLGGRIALRYRRLGLLRAALRLGPRRAWSNFAGARRRLRARRAWFASGGGGEL